MEEHVPVSAARRPDVDDRREVRRSLVVGDARDSMESEADRIADHVVAALRTPGPRVPEGAADDRGRVRRSAYAGPEGGALDRSTEAKIQAARGGGRPIAADVADRFGSAMGADLGGVRIHRSVQADQLNQQIGARAFTIGNDVFMSNGAPEAGSRAGDHLLAHELTHVVQQTGHGR